MSLFLVFLVLLMGKVGMGAQRWLVLGPIRMQPSEFMKMGLVLAMARYFTKVYPERQIGFKELIVPGIITMIPAVLVIIQPDLGTGMLLLFIFSMMIFYKRLKWKTIVSLGLISLVSGVLMYNFGLREYQRKRIHTFIDPYEDARGSGYNAIQSDLRLFDPAKSLTPFDEKFDWKFFVSSEELDRTETMQKRRDDDDKVEKLKEKSKKKLKKN